MVLSPGRDDGSPLMHVQSSPTGGVVTGAGSKDKAADADKKKAKLSAFLADLLRIGCVRVRELWISVALHASL